MLKSLSPRLFRKLSLQAREPSNEVLSGRCNDRRDHDRRPSPSLVPLPDHVASRCIKDRLPLLKYRDFLEKKDWAGECGGTEEEDVCIVCMNGLDGNDEVWEQGNCGHVYHRECLDAWIDRDNAVCPLCRARLLPSDSDDKQREGEDGGEYDPWRAERMVYLFGEDCHF